MNLETYITDILGLQIGLMTAEEIEKTREQFEKETSAVARRRRELSGKAQDARAVARVFGGRALTGTRRQKEWAEKIRAEKIKGMDEAGAILACRPEGLGKSSKFWIENRSKSAQKISDFFKTQTKLMSEYKEAYDAKNEAAVKELAEKYNALTTKWGFE